VLESLQRHGYDIDRARQEQKLTVLRRSFGAQETLARIEAAFVAAVRAGAQTIRYLGNLGMGQAPLPARGADDVLELEPDAGLGNGGLGRLAACFLESLATLGMPGAGYGIDYEYGLFKQHIENGWQRELPDRWKTTQLPVFIDSPGDPYQVNLYGTVEHIRNSQGGRRTNLRNSTSVIGLPHDLPIVGFGGQTVNYLRLFSARSAEDFNLDSFNQGDYIRVRKLYPRTP
jgi:starch phosphorylase